MQDLGRGTILVLTSKGTLTLLDGESDYSRGEEGDDKEQLSKAEERGALTEVWLRKKI